MLPHALSSEACSLAPGEERLAVSVEIELSASGEPSSTRFDRSRIRSDARLDYDRLEAIFRPRQVAGRGCRAAGFGPRGSRGAERAPRGQQPRRSSPLSPSFASILPAR